jgi:hypothetical protein
MEQVASQFFFFRTHIKKQLVRLRHNFTEIDGNVEIIYQRLESEPHRLTVVQLRNLLDANPFALEYLYGLGREPPGGELHTRDIVQVSTGAKEKAIQNLVADFDVVGITESMPTLFPLLSRKSRIPLDYLCETRDLAHNVEDFYKTTFGTNKRPEGASIFSEEVWSTLREEMADSIEVYEAGKKLHLSQLREEFPEYSDMSNEDLVTNVGNLWVKACCNKQRSAKYPIGNPARKGKPRKDVKTMIKTVGFEEP